MAYSFQTFTTGQVLTAVQMNQIEANIRDHTHGSSGVNANFVSFVGSALTANSLSAVNLTSSRAVVGSLSAHNAVVNSAFNVGDRIHHHSTERLNVYHGRVDFEGGVVRAPSHPVGWTVTYSATNGVFTVTHSLMTEGYTVTVQSENSTFKCSVAVLVQRSSNFFKYITMVQSITNGVMNGEPQASDFILALD